MEAEYVNSGCGEYGHETRARAPEEGAEVLVNGRVRMKLTLLGAVVREQVENFISQRMQEMGGPVFLNPSNTGLEVRLDVYVPPFVGRRVKKEDTGEEQQEMRNNSKSRQTV